MKIIKFYSDCNIAKQGDMFRFLEFKNNKYYYQKPNGEVDYADEKCRGDSYGIIEIDTPEERLRFGIIQECFMLDMNTSNISNDIKDLDKDKLLEYFIKFKDLLLSKRESEIIDFII